MINIQKNRIVIDGYKGSGEMNTFLIWYTSGKRNEKIPRLITATSKEDAKERFEKIVSDWNEILSIEDHYI